MSDPLDPRLPPELEEPIFIFALYADWRNVANLSLVAQRVYYWLLPRIYEVVVFHFHRTDNGKKLRYSSRSLAYHGHHVRHIMLYNSKLPKVTGLFHTPYGCLEMCPNVTDIALWIKDEKYDESLINTLINLPHLTHLSWDFAAFQIGLCQFETQPPPPAIFTTVTHLELIGSYREVQPERIKEHFPNLTHIAFTARGQTPISVLQEALDRWADIEVVVWYFSESTDHRAPTVYPTSEHVDLTDPRVVVCDYGESFVETWYEGTRYGPSIWKVADETVDARRRARDA